MLVDSFKIIWGYCWLTDYYVGYIKIANNFEGWLITVAWPTHEGWATELNFSGFSRAPRLTPGTEPVDLHHQAVVMGLSSPKLCRFLPGWPGETTPSRTSPDESSLHITEPHQFTMSHNHWSRIIPPWYQHFASPVLDLLSGWYSCRHGWFLGHAPSDTSNSVYVDVSQASLEIPKLQWVSLL